MEIQNAQFLTLKQKIRIALSVFAIYWPIRQYLRRDYFGWTTIEHDWLIWLVELVVTVLYFTFWLNVTEWIEQRFVGSFRTSFLGESKLPAKLTTLFIAGLLAVFLIVAMELCGERYIMPWIVMIGSGRFDATSQEPEIPRIIGEVIPIFKIPKLKKLTQGWSL